MKIKELMTEAVKQRLDAKCWKGKHKEGTKIKGGIRVNNCVPNESVEEHIVKVKGGYELKSKHGNKNLGKYPTKAGAEKRERQIQYFKHAGEGVKEDWNSVNKKDKTDGLSQKAVNAYRRENPGSKLKTAVTKKPSELKAGSKDAKRRKSFCARMSGNKGPMKDEKGRPTPKAKALNRWNCE